MSGIDDQLQVSLHSLDPADIVTELDERELRVAKLVASFRPSWMRDALCTEFDVNLWFPTKGQRSQPAYDICGRCPVRTECLDEALADPDLDHGIRGGMSTAARRQRRKADRRASEGRR